MSSTAGAKLRLTFRVNIFALLPLALLKDEDELLLLGLMPLASPPRSPMLLLPAFDDYKVLMD